MFYILKNSLFLKNITKFAGSSILKKNKKMYDVDTHHIFKTDLRVHNNIRPFFRMMIKKICTVKLNFYEIHLICFNIFQEIHYFKKITKFTGELLY